MNNTQYIEECKNAIDETFLNHSDYLDLEYRLKTIVQKYGSKTYDLAVNLFFNNAAKSEKVVKQDDFKKPKLYIVK